MLSVDFVAVFRRPRDQRLVAVEPAGILGAQQLVAEERHASKALALEQTALAVVHEHLRVRR
mgnify:CR=1 FL=1